VRTFLFFYVVFMFLDALRNGRIKEELVIYVGELISGGDSMN
ncbi:hypothetical protein THOM_2313, partial [Trachipleistophora hominis]